MANVPPINGLRERELAAIAIGQAGSLKKAQERADIEYLRTEQRQQQHDLLAEESGEEARDKVARQNFADLGQQLDEPNKGLLEPAIAFFLAIKEPLARALNAERAMLAQPGGIIERIVTGVIYDADDLVQEIADLTREDADQIIRVVREPQYREGVLEYFRENAMEVIQPEDFVEQYNQGMDVGELLSRVREASIQCHLGKASCHAMRNEPSLSRIRDLQWDSMRDFIQAKIAPTLVQELRRTPYSPAFFSSANNNALQEVMQIANQIGEQHSPAAPSPFTSVR